MDSVDRWRYGISITSLVIIFSAVVYMGDKDYVAKPMGIGSDTLGPDSDETFSEYHQRSLSTVATALEEHPHDHAYGLVCFNQQLSAPDAAATVAKLQRINGLQIGGYPIVGIPAPVNIGLAQHFVQQAELKRLDSNDIRCVVAHDEPTQFSALQSDPRVASIEVLPPDAAWGRFSVKPVLGAHHDAQ
ncbi:MAG: hypothetical protein Q4A31_05815 [Corynebacterium sp.]|uniref:hypothetical protein n=1 Tax=Corynebacterium sp. TaxID=1720 RepID=UPI0026DBF14E|nr:hypothetical protein [Corynebacterium sp.]MDO4761416.1 hypothetical protein [Corynebacterium sp.]